MTANVERFEKELERLNRVETPDWLKSYRLKAMARFRELGWPDKRQENWKYTSLKPLSEKTFVVEAVAPAFSQATLEPLRIAGALELVFIDGKFREDLSRVRQEKGIEWKSLRETLRGKSALTDLTGRKAEENNAFTVLNSAFVSDGVWLRIADNMRFETPIHFLHYSVSGSLASHPRSLVRVGKGASASLVETFAGRGDCDALTNSVTELDLDANSELHHVQIQESAHPAFQLSRTLVAQGRDSRFDSLVVQFGGQLTRNELEVRLEGENAQCRLDGLFVAGGDAHVDNYTTVDHLVPHGSSSQLYKGILGGSSTGVFNGRVVVEKNAQKTDARQTNKNLLLTDEATINTKPQLEILADDVKCTHGATIGQIEEEPLFYLRSRGIGESDARSLLTFAFASEVLSRVGQAPIREHLERRLRLGFSRVGLAGKEMP